MMSNYRNVITDSGESNDKSESLKIDNKILPDTTISTGVEEDITTDAVALNDTKKSLTGSSSPKASKNKKRNIVVTQCNNVHIGNVVNVQKRTTPAASLKSVPKITCEIREIFSRTDKASDEVMDEVAKRLGSKWKRVGRKLGLDSGVLETIEYDNRHESLHEIIFQMLREWRQQKSSLATVGTLCQALWSCDAGVVVKHLLTV